MSGISRSLFNLLLSVPEAAECVTQVPGTTAVERRNCAFIVVASITINADVYLHPS